MNPTTRQALADALKQFPAWFAGLFAVPVALLVMKPGDTHLPPWAWRWDDPAYGVNGDPYWAGHCDPTNFFSRWNWLAIRNSLGGLSARRGVPYARLRKIEYIGDPYIANVPKGQSGTLDITATLDDGSILRQHYIVRQWGNSGKCYRLSAGYKLQEALHWYLRTGEFETRPDNITPVFSWNPLMTYAKG